jgi:hypothetical protein
MNKRIVQTVVLMVPMFASAVVASAQQMDPQEIHDRLVAVLQKNANRPIVAGDTFVTWSPNPVLFNTVHRTADSVISSLVRADGMVGTAETVWEGSHSSAGKVLWTEPDTVLLNVAFSVKGGLLVTRDGVQDTVPLPEGLWAVADYGMEDQLIPLIREVARLGGTQHIRVYRPYPDKWDELSVRVQQIPNGEKAELVDESGEVWRWVLFSPSEILVAIRRSKHPDVVRTPLANTALFAHYMRLKDYARP